MIDLLDELTKYLASKLLLTPGINIFYNEMPLTPDKCIVIQEKRPIGTVPPQIDAEEHLIKVVARDTTNTAAKQLAAACYRWILTDALDYTTDTDVTGFITLLNGLSVGTQLNETPLWDSTDSTGRKCFYFTATMITKRLI